MRLITIILAIIVGFCAIKPGIEVLSLTQGEPVSCCSGQCTPILDSDGDDTDNTTSPQQEEHQVCNPFLACCACVVTCETPILLAFKNITFSINEVFSYTSPFSSLLIFDCWKPPQLG